MSESMVYGRTPIPELIEMTLRHINERGYSPKTIENYRRVYDKMREYSLQTHTSFYNSEFGKEFIFNCYGMIIGNKEQGKLVNRAVVMLSDFQRFGMIFRQQYVQVDVFSLGYQTLFEEFMKSREKRNIAAGTIKRYRHFLHRFETFLLNRGVYNFSEINIHHINVYIQSLASYSKNTVSASIGLLKFLFGFAYENGYHAENFSDRLPHIKYSQARRLPAVFSESEIESALKCVDNNNPTGKRNYAMLLIAARLGLRVSDIISLRFASIDWNQKSISIVQKKTGIPLLMPLPDDVGWAIIDYLKNGRPKTEIECEYLFVRHTPPIDKLSSNAKNDLRRIVQKAGIKIKPNKKYGMHAFRHSLASNMLTKGVELSEIAQILGHKSTEVTEEYIRVTPDMLRECALEVDI